MKSVQLRWYSPISPCGIPPFLHVGFPRMPVIQRPNKGSSTNGSERQYSVRSPWIRCVSLESKNFHSITKPQQLIDKSMSRKLATMGQTQNGVVLRGDFQVTEYIAVFLRHVYTRTGFRFENFTTPRHLQSLLEELSFNRLPMRVWESLISTTVRIARMSQTVGQGLSHFGAFFIDVLIWLVRYLIRWKLLTFAVFLMGLGTGEVVTAIIVGIFYFIEFFSGILWSRLSSFIQSNMISAPYYSRFIAGI